MKSLGFLFCAVLLIDTQLAHSQDYGGETGVSPKKPWGEFTIVEEEDQDTPWWSPVLLWIPNRILDAYDVFRIDAGVGPAVGGVLRLSKQGQMGYRQISPFSLRVGAFGRNSPVKVETSNEFGIGPGYVASKDRQVCPGEIGLGLDVLLVGGYAGICSDELLDFVAGIFFFDVKDDDIRPH